MTITTIEAKPAPFTGVKDLGHTYAVQIEGCHVCYETDFDTATRKLKQALELWEQAKRYAETMVIEPDYTVYTF